MIIHVHVWYVGEQYTYLLNLKYFILSRDYWSINYMHWNFHVHMLIWPAWKVPCQSPIFQVFPIELVGKTRGIAIGYPKAAGILNDYPILMQAFTSDNIILMKGRYNVSKKNIRALFSMKNCSILMLSVRVSEISPYMCRLYKRL